jgi:signal transduction histidine kinase
VTSLDSGLLAVFDQLGDAVLALDDGGRVIYLNPPAACRFGAAEAVVGRPLTALLPPATDDSLHQAVARVRAGGAAETVGRHDADHERWFDSRVVRLPGGVAVIEREVTEQRRTAEARADLERTLRFSESFIGVLGHDLRNPLSAIATGAELFRLRGADDKQVRAATRMLSSVERMARMIDQLLDFTRVRMGHGVVLEPAATDLEAICRQSMDELEHVAAERPVELTVEGDPAGQWDPGRLGQVVSNLLGNALTHGGDGAPVRLSIDGRDPARVCLEVRNAGAIPPERLPLVFEPFRGARVAGSSRASGLGLGLYITRQLVVAHGGSIDVTSSDIAGTAFIVVLPRVTTRAPA